MHTPRPGSAAEQPFPGPIHLEPWLVIVTGSHPSAETFDRPLAYRLREAIARRLKDDEVEHPHPRILICSDIWYMNQEPLRALPTISIGGPNVSALGAYLAEKLPSVHVRDGVLMVQLETDAGAPVASVWGIDAQATAGAVRVLEEKYLDVFLDAMPV